ncbi:multidrug ABC transporter ATP-binding protein, partial [Clostridium perfringens]
LVLLMVMFSSGLALLGPYLLGVGVDKFLDDVRNPDSSIDSTWLYFLVGLAAVYVLQALTTWLHNVWMIGIAQETVYRMRMDLFTHLHRLPIPFYGKRQQGEIMSRLTNDIENVSSTLNSSAIQIFS